MVKAYKLRIFPNKGKAKELNKLLSFWRDQVNSKIKTFWELETIRGVYPPKELKGHGRLGADASMKAWQIVKGAKKTKQIKKPQFRGNEIDLNCGSAHIIPKLRTKQFDIWFNVISLNKRRRLKLPCKRTGLFNKAVKRGELRKSFRIEKLNGEYYLTCFVVFPEVKKNNNSFVGIDVGLNNAIATSEGEILGEELRNLRIRTKWRRYKKKIPPFKQGLNRHAKGLGNLYPETDFVVEDLSFKGKRNRNKGFRRRNNNWAYNHLANQLEQIGRLEGFRLIKVNPAYSSQECPMCGFIDKGNRLSVDVFRCKQCGFEGNADCVAARNLVGRVPREHSVPETKERSRLSRR